MKIRNDGKPARHARGGVPGGTPPPPSAYDGSEAPNWHELVLAPHPDGPGKANPVKTFERRQDLGQVVVHEPFKVEFPSGYNGRHRRERRIWARAQGLAGEYAQLLVRRSPRAAQIPGVRLGMALYRQRDADRRRHEARRRNVRDEVS